MLNPHLMSLRAAHVLALLAAANSLVICTADTTAAGEAPACPGVPPTRYMVDVERYRFGGTCDLRNPAFYPIPQQAVSRESYLRCIDELNPAEIARHPNPGGNAAYADELQATAHASGIQVLRDDPEASVLRLELESNLVEWVLFNPGTKLITFAGIQSAEPYLDRTTGTP